MISSPVEKWVAMIRRRGRWVLLVSLFGGIAFLDFLTPPEYVLASLYAIPMLIAASFLQPVATVVLMILAVLATLGNLLFPHKVVDTAIISNRLLAVLSVVASAFFMVRHIRSQHRLREHEGMLINERHLAQMREDFIATLTHDLKTPLLGSVKALQYLGNGTFGSVSSEQREIIDVLLRSNHRLLDLVQMLVSAYKADNVGVGLLIAPLDLDDLVADSLTEVQCLALERNIAVSYFCKRTPPPVQADALQIRRVMANLLHNALNYTPTGGNIQVLLSEHSAHLLVEVLDNGPGISPDDLENVFNRFYHAGHAREMIGTGLGLYLSRQIIAAHQGKIWAENLHPTGCRFSFILPLSVGADSKTRLTPEEEASCKATTV